MLTLQFKQTNRKQLYLLPPSIDEWLPQDHLARFIVQITDSLDLSEIMKQYSNTAKIHIELRNPIVTLTLLHEEYIESCPNKQGYGFTWFCNQYKAYSKKINPSMHLVG